MDDKMRELPLKIRKEVEEYAKENGMDSAELIGRVRVLYNKALYYPEEAMGVVAAQSLSEPATQMSLDHNERVILKNNGCIITPKIGEFVDSVMDVFGKKEENGWEIFDFSDGEVFVPSITGKEKIEWKRVSSCSRHKAPEELIKIRTLSGREITATDSHSFVVRENNKIVPISGKQLKIGSRIPSMKFLSENCLQSLDLKDAIGETDSFIRKPLPEKIDLDKSLGWIFGAYLSEGQSTKYYVSFSNVDSEFLSKIRKFARSHGFTFNEYDNFRGFSKGHDIRINSIILSRLMKAVCGTGSGSKRVPYFSYGAKKEFVSGLLKGYFDGDGNVSVDRGMIRASSNSEELIDGIKLLLTRFGIFANKSIDKQFNLAIPYKYAGLFRENIGFSVDEKKERLERLCGFFGKNGKFQDFTDMVGGFGDLFLRTAKKLGYPTRYVNNFTGRQRIGRSTLAKYVGIFERLSESKGIDIENELKVMKTMLNSDVVWDKITEISRVRPSNDYVYDFTVEGTETFTTFDGIVTHNTMRTYHFAGVAGIQVTLGLPRLIEIYDAKKKPETPSMTIHLMKDYQSEEKALKVAKKIKEVKLRDFVVGDVIDLINLVIRLKLNKKKLRDFNLDVEDLKKHIKIKNVDVDVQGSEISVTSKKTENINLHKLKYKVMESHIEGVKGISHVIVSKEDEGWIISTLGSNLKKILAVEGVDPTKTTCNNIFEICSVLGIEAARNAIIQEAVHTIEEQGLGVDPRYVSLLADLMTYSGNIMGIGRYGIAGSKPSVIARMSFEETKKHIINASINGERDSLRGQVENIIMNQVIPLGTGAFRLIGRFPGEQIPREEREKPEESGKISGMKGMKGPGSGKRSKKKKTEKKTKKKAGEPKSSGRKKTKKSKREKSARTKSEKKKSSGKKAGSKTGEKTGKTKSAGKKGTTKKKKSGKKSGKKKRGKK